MQREVPLVASFGCVLCKYREPSYEIEHAYDAI
jgi:hypothetical protein